MKKNGIWYLLFLIIALSAVIAWAFVNPKFNDWPSLFVSCLGSVATVIAIPVAYKIFMSYSATADIQKRRFQIVEETFTFLISQKISVKTTESFVLLYLTEDRLEYFFQDSPYSEKDLNRTVFINSLFFEFIIDLSNKFNQLYFPLEMRSKFLSQLPNAMRQESPADDSIVFDVKPLPNQQSEELSYGVPFKFEYGDMSIKQLVDSLVFIKNELRLFLNKYLDSQYHIKT